MNDNNQLPRGNAKLTAEKLSSWLANEHPNRFAKPAGIRNNKKFKVIYAELTKAEQ
jgi:hypothetical protein